MSQQYGISAVDFGVVGDGKADDSDALQSALDAGSPRIVVPYGHYRLGKGLRLHSDIHLVVHPQATLRLADGAGRSEDVFLLTNSDHQSGNHNIIIEGGIWDGNNPANPRGPDEPGKYTGVMINFTNVEGLTLRALSLMDATSYFVRLGRVTDFLIEDISFEIKNLRPNQDGIHISGFCEDGIIRNLRGLGSRTPNDDMAALVADDALQRAQNRNGAFNGPIRRIRVENLRASSCHSFVRLLSVENEIEDVEIHDVKGGCRCCAINMDACRECRIQLFNDADHPNGVGSINNVRISDFNVYKATDDNNQPMIDFRTRTDNIVIERFERDVMRDVSPGTPTLRVEKSGELAMVAEGIENQTTAGDAETFVTADGPDSFRVEQTLGYNDTIEVREGGFDRVVVNRRPLD